MTIQWLTTSPNPRVVCNTSDDGQRGWRLHAIEASDDTRFKDVRSQPALCGLIPAHGWGMDLFIERKCIRCLRKSGLACPGCNGTGYLVGSDHVWCHHCGGNGERR